MSTTPTITGTITASGGEPQTTGPTLAERAASPVEQWLRASDAICRRIRCALPGIVVSFDATRQVVSVLPAIKEHVNGDDVPLPQLDDVPILLPRCGLGALTMPVQAGDECLLIFNDLCIDSWWQSGGVQSRMLPWRHQIGDAVALIGIWSQPNKLQGWSTNSIQLRNIAGSSYIELAGNNINLVAGNNTIAVTPTGITINGSAITVSASGQTSPQVPATTPQSMARLSSLTSIPA